jgi:hypothetical protein
MVKLDSAQHLVGSLNLNSEILDNIHSDFMKLLNRGMFYVHTFQEGKPINNYLGKVRHHVTTLRAGGRLINLHADSGGLLV